MFTLRKHSMSLGMTQAAALPRTASSIGLSGLPRTRHCGREREA